MITFLKVEKLKKMNAEITEIEEKLAKDKQGKLLIFFEFKRINYRLKKNKNNIN